VLEKTGGLFEFEVEFSSLKVDEDSSSTLILSKCYGDPYVLVQGTI